MKNVHHPKSAIRLAAIFSIFVGVPMLIVLGYEGFNNLEEILLTLSAEFSIGLTTARASQIAYEIILFLFEFTIFVLLIIVILRNLWIFIRDAHKRNSEEQK